MNKIKTSTISFRYGGWREGLESNTSVPANPENTAVYFNNKVCGIIAMLILVCVNIGYDMQHQGFHSVVAYLNAANNANTYAYTYAY